MPRPKIGVTLENMFLVRQYFDRAIDDNRLWNEETYEKYKILQAINDFKLLFSKEFLETDWTMEELEEVRSSLQSWIDQYVPSKKWQRCLKTLRQRKSRKKRHLHHLDLNQEVYKCVKELAQKFDLSLSETIYKVAKVELNKFHESEIKEEISDIN